MPLIDYDSVDDRLDYTITAVDDGDWTIGGWVYATSSGESNQGAVAGVLSGTNTRQWIQFNSSATNLICQQSFSTSNAQANWALPQGKWVCFFATFDGQGSTRTSTDMKYWYGDVGLAVDQVGTTSHGSYVAQNGASGTRDTGGTSCRWGNRVAAHSWDGRLMDMFFTARKLSLAEMEMFRLGWRTQLFDSSLRVYAPGESSSGNVPRALAPSLAGSFNGSPAQNVGYPAGIAAMGRMR